MKKILAFLLCCTAFPAFSQSFYRTAAVTIPGNGQTVTDTLNVAGLTAATLNASFGLDSISLRINYSHDEDLLVSLTAPDGTVLQLANNLGGGSANFTNTRFTMSVPDLINLSSPPFTGKMRPESWMGRVNNGQNGNGKWVLKIINTTGGNTTGTLQRWGLHFNNTPAPPDFFTTSSLPIVVINTNNVVPQHNIKNEVAGTMGIIANSNGVNTLGNAYNNYNGNIAIKVRGNTSADFAQKSYTVTTTLANGDDNDVSILGMSTGSNWVLYGAWDDKSFIRNVLTYQFSNEMGAYASRTRLCELVLNGDYKGVYVFMEKIKRGDGRVDVEKMNTSTVSGADLTGGYIFQVDRGESNDDHWESNYPPCNGSNGSISFVYEYPSDSKINNAQKAYLAGYVDSFEKALATVSLYDTANGYRKFIDVPSFIEQSLLQELGHNVDGYRLSSFLHKGKNRKLNAGPAWDFNLAFGNADYYNGSATDNFEWDMPCPFNDGNLNPFWWKKLVTDTAYMREYKCRYTNLRQTVLDTVHIDQVIDSLRSMLQVPQGRNFTRWPILGVYLWPNEFVGNTWQEEMDYLHTWIHKRVRWMDQQLYDTACLPAPPPLAINNPDAAARVALYPNPVNSLLHIEGRGTLIREVEVYSMTGQRLFTRNTAAARLMLNLKEEALPPGMYIVSVRTDHGLLRKKIVLQ